MNNKYSNPYLYSFNCFGFSFVVYCCFRCGREGHYVSSCYASKHINGYYLKNGRFK